MGLCPFEGFTTPLQLSQTLSTVARLASLPSYLVGVARFQLSPLLIQGWVLIEMNSGTVV